MKRISVQNFERIGLPRLQVGALTIYTGIFVLVFLTLLLVYATRISIIEQRISANEMRQKQAFHAAESGVSMAMEYLFANSILVASDKADIFPDGTDGWLAEGTGAVRWVECSAAGSTSSLRAANSHPCAGEMSDSRMANSYFFAVAGDDAATNRAPSKLDFDSEDYLQGANTAFSVWALLCVIEPDWTATPPVTNCTKSDEVVGEGENYMITLLATGYSDCIDADGSGAIEDVNVNGDSEIPSCKGEARVALPISNYNAASGSPQVPLTTKSTFPPGGHANIVANPNAGGVGVPLSVWANNNNSCPADPAIETVGGSWATCEAQGFYQTDEFPEDGVCPSGVANCSCGSPVQSSHALHLLSYVPPGESYELLLQGACADCDVGLDFQVDQSFPCDLFEFYFGVPKSMYQIVKAGAQIVEDCSSLDEYSYGVIWVSGPTCDIRANTTVGSMDTPVVLVSAASHTQINGGAQIFGTVYIADMEDPNAVLDANGTSTIVGALIVDAHLGHFSGTFNIVYEESALADASGSDGLGVVPGGWRDFDIPDME